MRFRVATTGTGRPLTLARGHGTYLVPDVLPRHLRRPRQRPQAWQWVGWGVRRVRR